MRTLNLIKSTVYCVIGKREGGGGPVTARGWKGEDEVKRQLRRELMETEIDTVVGWREERKMGVWL